MEFKGKSSAQIDPMQNSNYYLQIALLLTKKRMAQGGGRATRSKDCPLSVSLTPAAIMGEL